MATRTVNIALIEQRPQQRRLIFTPDLASLGGSLLLEFQYETVTADDGTGSIDLPVADSGEILYNYEIPGYPGASIGSFAIGAGSAIDLDDLIVAGGVASDSVIAYVDAEIAALPGNDADLIAIAALDSSVAGMIASIGAGWVKKTFSEVKTLLSLTKSDVGLGNVDNTSDANKPVSTAQAAADTAAIATAEAYAIQRANHTGTQAQSTITNLVTDLAAKEATANKDASGGYAGLTLFKINFRNAANTYTSFLTNSNTAARTYTFQDKDGTIADTADVAAIVSDAAYDATSWNGVTTIAPSKNAIRDKIESLASMAIGVAVGSGTSGSVLFVDSSGFLAQDNTNFFRDTSTFKAIQTADAVATPAFQYKFRGFDGAGYTTGLEITATSGSAYYPIQINVKNTAYNKAGTIAVTNINGLDFGGVSPARWSYASSVSGGVSSFAIYTGASAQSPGIASIITGYTTQVGLYIKLAASATADAINVYASDGTTKLFAVNSAGNPIIPTKTPASASASGTTGMIAWDSSYIYICSATNTWLRAAIATW